MWNLINKPDELWCKVLISKYGRSNDLMISGSSQPYNSPLWKALAGIWNDFQRHVFSQIGNGRQTNLWMDKWVPKGGVLLTSASQNLIHTTLSVRDVLTPEGNWDLIVLQDNLPNTIVNQVVALPSPNDADGPDA